MATISSPGHDSDHADTGASAASTAVPPILRRSCLLLAAACLAPGELAADNNEDLQAAISGLIGAHNVALPTSLTPVPGFSDAAEAITYGTNIALKYIKAPFTAPGDKTITPTQGDKCTVRLTIPQTEAQYSNLLGIWDTTPLPGSWGPLGKPSVRHANTDVVVAVEGLGAAGVLARQATPQTIELPAGNHRLRWQAVTQVSPLFDYVLPVVVYGITNIKYGKAAPALADSSARQAARQAKFQKAIGETLINIGIELQLIAADMALDLGEDTVTHSGPEHIQGFTVFDVNPPVISTTAPEFTIEATDFGGALYSRNQQKLVDTIIASDPCGREYSLSNDAPFLLPLGDNVITWTVSDRGPNESFQTNKTTLQQIVRVQDTQAPIMIPPPGRVLEVTGSGQEAVGLRLGLPRVVDLADSSPVVRNDAPDFFPVNSRTPVLWETEDASGNIASATQLITVKPVGSNTTPTADAKTVSTLTSQPVDIVLSGQDSDLIDGRFDPLSFFITRPPQNGEFIAPLLPYFIEDYRTRPEGPFGEEFLLLGNRNNFVYDNYCRRNIEVPRDFVYSPRFIQITDDGTQYIRDSYWRCNPSDATTSDRVSKWDRDGNFLGQTSVGSNTLENFVLDRDGHIYFVSSVGAGSSTSLFLSRCSTDFSGAGSSTCDSNWKFNYASARDLNPSTLVYARVDSQRGVVFVTDKIGIHAFDISSDGNDSEYLGALNENYRLLENCSAAGRSRGGFTIEIDSRSNLYIADSCADRIHKFGPSVFKTDGEFVSGDYIGWLGKCDTSTNNACDEQKGRSKGYSCTDATCSVSNPAGDRQGQFNTPLHIALDPNDILYVADYDNQRIQRFTPDGSFAGEAQSTGTGINMGDEPSFILGNFAPPRTVSVNSTQFFIVDQAESFVHVFETSPLKDITDSSATVTYVSEFSFHSAMDSFAYYVSDGLADSEPANVDIFVNRAFRPPEAIPADYVVLEDRQLVVELAADDPDGVIGSGDFNALDILDFRIVTPPLHGELSGNGATYRYSPDADYHGTDSFTFVANDGVFDSPPATVTIEVEPVNDPPDFDLDGTEFAGVGFPYSVLLNFRDDSIGSDGGSVHDVVISWGDGTVDSGDQADGDEPRALVVSPASEGSAGIVTGSHVYQTAGNRTLRICITDPQGASSCRTRTVQVEERVSLALDTDISAEALGVGDRLDYTVTLVNMEPDAAFSGNDAAEVEVMHILPPGLQLTAVDSSTGDCTQSGSQVSCQFGNLSPGAERSMTLSAVHSGGLLAETESELATVAMTSSLATREFYLGYELTTLEAGGTDSDNDGMFDAYETANGLDPNVNDAGQDLDADGLSNLEEFQRQTAANDSDSDNDGIPDGWEVEFGLDPLSGSDADMDGDEDGFSNRDEFLADRDPLTNENSGDRLVPILSVFADSNLFVPATRVGLEVFDLEFALINDNPVVFQLQANTSRDIRVEVTDSAIFNLNSNVLDVPLIDVEGEFYQAQLQLINDNPVQLQLLSATGATVSP